MFVETICYVKEMIKTRSVLMHWYLAILIELNWIYETVHIHWELEIPIVLTSIWRIWTLSCSAKPMLAGTYIAAPRRVQQYHGIHFASTKLGPGSENGDQSFPIHSALDDIR